MSIGLPLHKDSNAVELRQIARRTKDASQVRRALALATIYAGGSRDAAAAIGGIGRQIGSTRCARRRSGCPMGADEGQPTISRRFEPTDSVTPYGQSPS